MSEPIPRPDKLGARLLALAALLVAVGCLFRGFTVDSLTEAIGWTCIGGAALSVTWGGAIYGTKWEWK